MHLALPDMNKNSQSRAQQHAEKQGEIKKLILIRFTLMQVKASQIRTLSSQISELKRSFLDKVIVTVSPGFKLLILSAQLIDSKLDPRR